MIEMAMFFGLGFLAACLIMIFVANAVWRRAVRLTTQRVQASMPISLAEIKADRDQLRAEFALSTRRLEVAVDDLKRRGHSQLVDIARKNDQIRVLLGEVKERTETLRGVEEREKALRDELLAAEARHGDMARALKAAEERLAKASTLLAERETALSNAEATSNERRVEIAALQTNVAQYEDRVADLRRSLAHAEEDRAEKQARLLKVETELAQAGSRIVALQTEMAAATDNARLQAEEVGRAQAKIAELTAQLSGQIAEIERMAGRIQELSAERDALDEALAKRTADAELRASSLLDELQTFRTEKADLEGRLAAERAERDRITDELRRLEGAAQVNWERERVENALLRERINDLATEISNMAEALEGQASPGERVVARAEAEARNTPALPAAASAEASLPVKPQDPRAASLAERVRALRTRASAET